MNKPLIELYFMGLFDETVCDLFGITADTVNSYADAMTFRTNEQIMTARRVRLAFLVFLLECDTLRDCDGNPVYYNHDSEVIKELARIAPRCPDIMCICDKLSEVVR